MGIEERGIGILVVNHWVHFNKLSDLRFVVVLLWHLEMAERVL